MNWLLSTLVTAVVTFVVTNLDDIVLLMLFFSQTNAQFQRRHVVVGQYLGFFAILAVSLVGFFGSLWIPERWIGFLGLLPIAIALKQLFSPDDDEDELSELEHFDNYTAKPSPFSSLFNRYTYGVAAVTFANGGDNIGVYVPLFASVNLAQLITLIAAFLGLTGAWCYLGFFVSRHPAVARVLERYGHWIVPIVLICLGIYIIVENDTLSLFFEW